MMPQQSSQRILPAVGRRAISAAPPDWVLMAQLDPATPLPLVVSPTVPEVDLVAWAGKHRALLEAHLLRHGALLFRSFGAGTAKALGRFVEAVSGGALPYLERSSPRSPVEGNVYTSTDHPADYRIFLHNEQSYNLVFPLRIFFACQTAALVGGETPIADVRRVLARLDPKIVERFAERRYRYVRNFGDGLGLSWQTAFQTSSRAEVEAYCRENEIGFEWRDRRRLRTWQVREAIARHPVSGDLAWFNHATFFNVTTLDQPVREALLASGGELPNDTCYGDGAPIEPGVLDELRAAYEAEMVSFPWQEGDLLMVDNVLVAHGRAPFRGPRSTLVAMSTPVPWERCRPLTC